MTRAFLDSPTTVESRILGDDSFSSNVLGVLFYTLAICALVFFVFFLPRIIQRRKETKNKRLITISGHATKVDSKKVVTVSLIGMNEVQLVKGEIFIAPFPEKEGFFFMGWFYDSACTDPYKNAVIKKDMTLYPKWIKSS